MGSVHVESLEGARADSNGLLVMGCFAFLSTGEYGSRQATTLPSAAFERMFLDGFSAVSDGEVTLGRGGTLMSLAAEQS